MLRTGRWHLCQCCNNQVAVLGGTTPRHIHLLPVGSPCLHCCSTKPSWPQTSIAIVGLGRSHTATALVRAALAVDSAAPLLLCDGPACLPVGETIRAIVRVGRRGGLRSWHDNGLRSWHDDGRRCGWRAAEVV